MLWLPRIRWRVLEPEEALALGLEQVGRIEWAVLEFVWLNFGFTMLAEGRLLS